MQLLTFDEAAEALGCRVTRVTQLVRDGQLVVARDDESGRRGVPVDMIQDGAVVKALPAVITLLRDAHFADHEILDWLSREDESLPGSPLSALRANRGTEVKRRAQAAGF